MKSPESPQLADVTLLLAVLGAGEESGSPIGFSASVTRPELAQLNSPGGGGQPGTRIRVTAQPFST